MSSLRSHKISHALACYNPILRSFMRKKPPFLLHLLGILFLLASLVFLAGVIRTAASWNWLTSINYRPFPVYNVFENVFLFLVFLAAAVVLWLRTSWAGTFGQAASLLAAAWYWIDRIILTQVPASISENLFPAIATILILFLILTSLSLLKPYMRSNAAAKEPGENDEKSST